MTITMCGGTRIRHRVIRECWTCKRRTRQIARWGGVYYGYTHSCVACGDEFDYLEGYRYPRPFQRGWRKRQRTRFAREWAECLTAEQGRAAVKEDIRYAMEVRV